MSLQSVHMDGVVGMLIDGRRIITDRTFTVHYPGTGFVIAEVAQGSGAEIEAALISARRAFKHWSRQPAFLRANILFKTSELLLTRSEEFAQLITAEAGKPITESRAEVARAIELLRYTGEEAKRISGETIPLDALSNGSGRFGFTQREPLGVITAITPFNFPLALVLHKIAPAIGSGNTVILKPASATPLTALRLAQLLLETGLPPGVLNVLTIKGDALEPLITDPRIAMISFTGSVPIGESIRAKAGLKRVTLELGSNSATIVHSDADLGEAALACTKAGYAYSGQVCVSLQRIYVQRSVQQAFLEHFVPLVKALRVGDPFDPTTDVGPMLNQEEAQRADSWVKEAIAQGAQVVCGGTQHGAYYEPTILTHVNPDMSVVCHEAFAPIVSVTPYESFDQAIALVNDSEYGLQAGVFTRDIRLAFKAAREIHVGGIIINDTCRYRADHLPYGGVKRSGLGREGVKYAMEEMTEIKTVIFRL